MKEYIGLLSVIYIIAVIIKLKDNSKTFEDYTMEYEEVKVYLRAISQRKDPFILMKLSSFVFYIFLFLYYIANSIVFDSYTITNFLSYALLIFGLFKLSKKISINSIDDLEKSIDSNKKTYKIKQKINFYLGLLEFAYAFNVLVLISF
ncbi:hypothetical protein [Halonatronum saccharophilum]|uniref:hypothetical protein n=1 Tax=Halonatronum saccharophilum TaxID=150060 RepID=UPI000486B7F9|nr:hypothetical protein [Halonatronum saccharophilum]